ncbi:FluC/FEX family fluoride channel [Tessaracoccus sp. Z1128]
MTTTPGPAYLRPSLIGLVALGGAAGTALRHAIESAFGASAGEFPWATFAINVTGAMILGALLESLALVRAEGGRRRVLQLTLGTGLLGGYTTYSTFVLETLTLGRAGDVALAATYAAASLLAGFIAALAAMTALRRIVRAARPI